MKKKLFGYDVRETDEMIEYLQSQNDSLTAKLTNMSMKLSAQKEKIETTGSLTDSQRIELKAAAESAKEAKETAQAQARESAAAAKELEKKANELSYRLAETEKKLRAAALENEKLKARNTELSSSVFSQKSELEQVGVICRRAYADMVTVQDQSTEQMKGYVDEFSDKAAAANEKMRSAAEGIILAKERARAAFIAAAEEILTNFDAIAESSGSLTDMMQPVDNIRFELMEKIDKMVEDSKINAFSANTPSYDIPVAQEEAEEPEAPYPDLPPLLSRALIDDESSSSSSKNATSVAKPKPEKKDGYPTYFDDNTTDSSTQERHNSQYASDDDTVQQDEIEDDKITSLKAVGAEDRVAGSMFRSVKPKDIFGSNKKK